MYSIKSPNGPGLNCPLVIDPSGTYFRREGLADMYLCGRAPAKEEEEPSTEDLSVDDDYFTKLVWPQIAHRCPSFERLKVKVYFVYWFTFSKMSKLILKLPKFIFHKIA